MIRWALLLAALFCGVAFAIELALIALDPPAAVADNPRRMWTVAWLFWLLLTVAIFAVIEGLALINDHGGDTLTEHIQFVAGQSPVWAGAIGLGVAAFFAWLLSHLFGRDSRVWVYLTQATPEPFDDPDRDE